MYLNKLKLLRVAIDNEHFSALKCYESSHTFGTVLINQQMRAPKFFIFAIKLCEGNSRGTNI